MDKQKEQDQYFTTKDLFASSFILASGKARLVSIINDPTSTYKLFRFEPKLEASEAESEYFTGASATAKVLFAQYKHLRNLLFEARKEVF